MSLPTTVKVVSKKWKVSYVPSGHQDLEHPDIGTCYGMCYHGDCKIVVDVDVDYQNVVETLWHELTHALEGTLGLNMTEQQVHALAAGQIALLKDNKQLAALLLGNK